MKQRAILSVGIVALVAGFLWFRSQPKSVPQEASEAPEIAAASVPEESQNSRNLGVQKMQTLELTQTQAMDSTSTSNFTRDSGEADASNDVTYVVEDGVAVVNEDIVIGVPRSARARGSISLETVHLWEDGIVPFHIQADLPNKERVIQALAQFVDTPVKFIPYTDQEDVLVFEVGSGCKSYLGKVGGKQPIWLSGGCSSREIAHEIMHALGFIHEQNRSDRDRFIDIVWDNIQEPFKHNYEVFPASLMAVSGQAPFDFESIMLYQATAFGKSPSEPTMTARIEGKIIAPSATLSVSDILRIERAYGRR